MAFLLASLLIAVTSLSLVFVGFVASRASNQQAVANEARLLRSTLADMKRSIVQDQIGIASSDLAVKRLVLEFDARFVQSTFDDLWSDHSYSKSMLISGGGNVVAETFEDNTYILDRPIGETAGLEAIVGRLTAKYRRNRTRVPGGFGHRSLQGIDFSEYAVMGFTKLDGKPALFGAMPIIPDDYKVTLPDGPPTILLSARYIDANLLERLNRHLSFSSLAFRSGSGSQQDGPLHPVLDQSGSPLGVFQWKSQTVSTSIWPTVIPVIVILGTALAALAFGIAWKIGQLTTSLQSSEQQNRYLALHDSLSGLANRLQFTRMLEAAVKSLPDTPFAVLHCDLDNFKPVNDTFGHSSGDLVIQTIASRLKKTIANQGLVCRVGGDEFMIIYHGLNNKAHLARLGRTLVANACAPIPITENEAVHVGLSVGIARAPIDGKTPETLVGASDMALYNSKVMGRGQVSFFSEIRTTSQPVEPQNDTLDGISHHADAV
ncbi:MAG: diguanylate cyclase [Roseibium sp.]|nr:diguanylate cyclase [Roseibium sp.]